MDATSEVLDRGRAAGRVPAASASRPTRPFHVGVLFDNTPEFWFALGACAVSGATLVGINPTRRGAELARDIQHTDCALLLTEPTHLGLLEGAGRRRRRPIGCSSSTSRSGRDALAPYAGAPLPDVDDRARATRSC